MDDIPRILIVGGGYVGMYTALRLQRKLHHAEASVTVVDPRSTMTYQPFLAETAGGSIEPRHVVVPLRKVLRRFRVVTGTVTAVDAGRRVAAVLSAEGDRIDIPYDILVLAAGSLPRTLPVPGLAEHASASTPSPRRSTCATTSCHGWTLPPASRTRSDAGRR